MRALRAVWHTLTAPPVQERIFLVMYVGAIAGGVWIMLEPPRTVEGAWGSALTGFWSLLLMVGGMIGACTVRTREQWLERIGLGAVSGFLALYASFLLTQHVMTEGSRAAGLTVVFFGTIAVALRWAEIRDLDFTRPRRGAAWDGN